MSERESPCEFRPDEFGTIEGGVPLPESMKGISIVDPKALSKAYSHAEFEARRYSYDAAYSILRRAVADHLGVSAE